MRTDEQFAVVSALLDREPVDPDALASVLEDPEGRTRLVDFVRLRVMAARELALDGEQEGRTSVRPVDGRVRAPSMTGRLLRRAAAVLLPLALVAGYAVWQEGRPEPPMPDRVVEFTPGVDWRLQ